MNVAFVIARYGDDVQGGVEKLAQRLAETLVATTEWHVEVLTSCSQHHETWEDEYPAGQHHLNNVSIRRFPTTPWDLSERHQLNLLLNKNHKLPAAQQYAWINSGEHCLALYEFLQQHHAKYDAIVVMPYLSTVAFTASWVAIDKTVVISCLHDELYAYLEPTRLLLESAQGVMLNTVEELTLATQKVGIRMRRHAVVGVGVEPIPDAPSAVAIPTTPYILYVGRVLAAKNLTILFDYAERLYDEHGIQLVIVGRGTFSPADHPAFDWRTDADDAAKLALAKHAIALCQPSLNESFSRVIMEAWQVARPVLVHADSPVTVGHVQRSGGGLTFKTYGEYRDAALQLHENQSLAEHMGQQGQQYVTEHYTWETISARFVTTLSAWQQEWTDGA